jgi:hypothetical protein
MKQPIGFLHFDSKVDFTVRGGGSVYLLHPNTEAAKEWLAANIPDDAQYLGRSLAVEHRFIEAIAYGIENDGLSIE